MTPDNLESVTAVLLVDDEQDLRDSISAGLQQKGYGVIACATAAAALAALKERAEKLGSIRVTAIVSDWAMEGQDGIGFLQSIRKGPYRDTPFVLMSGSVTREQLQHAVRVDADGVILKPFSIEALCSKVEEAVSIRTKKEFGRITGV